MNIGENTDMRSYIIKYVKQIYEIEKKNIDNDNIQKIRKIIYKTYQNYLKNNSKGKPSIKINRQTYYLLGKNEITFRFIYHICYEYNGVYNDFYLYRSISEGGLLRLCYNEPSSTKLEKDYDYVLTSGVYFELQNFINEIDNNNNINIESTLCNPEWYIRPYDYIYDSDNKIRNVKHHDKVPDLIKNNKLEYGIFYDRKYLFGAGITNISELKSIYNYNKEFDKYKKIFSYANLNDYINASPENIREQFDEPYLYILQYCKTGSCFKNLGEVNDLICKKINNKGLEEARNELCKYIVSSNTLDKFMDGVKNYMKNYFTYKFISKKQLNYENKYMFKKNNKFDNYIIVTYKYYKIIKITRQIARNIFKHYYLHILGYEYKDRKNYELVFNITPIKSTITEFGLYNKYYPAGILTYKILEYSQQCNINDNNRCIEPHYIFIGDYVDWTSKLDYKLKGLLNIGNSCYMNSAIQLLVAAKDLTELVLSSENNNFYKNFLQEYYLDKDVTREELIEEIPKEMKKLDVSCSIFTEGKQQDANEFITYFINILKKNIDKNKFNELLNIGTTQIITCNNCPYQSENSEFSQILQLSLPGITELIKPTLMNFINNFSKIETLNDWNCDNCKNLGGTKKINITTLPKYLYIQLNRFDYNTEQTTKIENEIIIPNILNINELTEKDNQGYHYKLQGFIRHIGTTIDRGHYISYIKNNNKWFKINDNIITEENEKDALNEAKKSYIILYVKEKI
jgi:ubiquitin C-terminal hydrolase